MTRLQEAHAKRADAAGWRRARQTQEALAKEVVAEAAAAATTASRKRGTAAAQRQRWLPQHAAAAAAAAAADAVATAAAVATANSAPAARARLAARRAEEEPHRRGWQGDGSEAASGGREAAGSARGAGGGVGHSVGGVRLGTDVPGGDAEARRRLNQALIARRAERLEGREPRGIQTHATAAAAATRPDEVRKRVRIHTASERPSLSSSRLLRVTWQAARRRKPCARGRRKG